MAFSTTNQYIVYDITLKKLETDITNNRTKVRVTVECWRTNGYETYGSGTVYVNINGTEHSASITSSQKITSTKRTLITCDQWITHNNDGTKTIYISASITHSRFSSSTQGKNFPLETIPRRATITSCNSFNDEQNPSFSFSNPGNWNMECWLEPNPNGTHYAIRTVSGKSGTYIWNLTDDERKQLRSACKGKTCTIRVGLYSKDKTWNSYVDKTYTIINAEPTIEDISYYDSDASIADITKDDQLIVQGKSSFAVDIPKATAKKEATIAKYTIEFLNVKRDETATSKIIFGTLDANTDFELKVTATDSRGYTISKTKTVKVLEYAMPTLSATAERLNNYEAITTLHAYGSISSINEQNTMSIAYQYKKAEGTYSNWIEIENDTDVEATFDNESAYEIKFRLVDKFSTVTYTTMLAKGIPFAFFDVEKLSMGVNKFPEQDDSFETDNFYYLGKQLLDLIVPVGTQIYNSQKEFDPNTLYQGTEWTRIKGYVLAGINEDDADTDEHTSFNQEAGTAIGSKYLQKHSHVVPIKSASEEATGYGLTQSQAFLNRVAVTGNGVASGNYGTGDSQNIQPSMLTYIWERVK